MIRNKSNKSQKKAKPKARKLKKIIFHEKLTARLKAYILSAVYFWLFGASELYIIAALIPIKIKSMLQTIGKSIAGGESGG